jgi:membrane protease YdiL (CAAX protease family)
MTLQDSLPKWLVPAVVAILLTVAARFSFLTPSIPMPLRFLSHAMMVPLLAVLLFRQPLPRMAMGIGQTWPLLAAIFCVWGFLLIAGAFGFERTYSDWRIALAIAAWQLPFIPLVLRLPERLASTYTVSTWWFFAAGAGTLFVWPNGYADDPGPLGGMVSNFFFTGMTEELVFRGVIQGYLLSRWRGRWLGLSAANWVTAVLFAWSHNVTLEPNHLPWFIHLLPAGLLYGVIRERTGSWLASGIAHGLMIPALYFWGALGVIKLS